MLNVFLGHMKGRGQIWYHSERSPDAFLGFYLRESFQSQTNTEKISYNKSQ